MQDAALDVQRQAALIHGVEEGAVGFLRAVHLHRPACQHQGIGAARAHGLFYAPDPASYRTCTIGGNVAENAGGPHTLIYGVTTNHVLGVEAVLPDGMVVMVPGGLPLMSWLEVVAMVTVPAPVLRIT